MSNRNTSYRRRKRAPSDASDHVLFLEITPYEFHAYHSSFISNEDFRRNQESSMTALCRQILSGTSTDKDVLHTKRAELQKLQNVINFHLDFQDIYNSLESAGIRDLLVPPESRTPSISTTAPLSRKRDLERKKEYYRKYEEVEFQKRKKFRSNHPGGRLGPLPQREFPRANQQSKNSHKRRKAYDFEQKRNIVRNRSEKNKEKAPQPIKTICPTHQTICVRRKPVLFSRGFQRWVNPKKTMFKPPMRNNVLEKKD